MFTNSSLEQVFVIHVSVTPFRCFNKTCRQFGMVITHYTLSISTLHIMQFKKSKNNKLKC